MWKYNISPRSEGRSVYYPYRPRVCYGKKLQLNYQKEYHFEEPSFSFLEMDKLVRGDSLSGYYEMNLSSLESRLIPLGAILTGHKSYYYDNHLSTYPTRTHSYQSNGDVFVERILTPLEYIGTDPIIKQMRDSNIFLAVLSKQTLIKRKDKDNYELIKEIVTNFKKIENPQSHRTAYFPTSLIESIGSPGLFYSNAELTSALRSEVMALPTNKYRKSNDQEYLYKDNKFIVNQVVKLADRNIQFFNMLSNDLILKVSPTENLKSSQVDAKNMFCYYSNYKASYPKPHIFNNYIAGSDDLVINKESNSPVTYKVFVVCHSNVTINCSVNGSSYDKQLSPQVDNLQLMTFEITTSRAGEIRLSPKEGFVAYMMIIPQNEPFSASCYDKLNRLICRFDQNGKTIYYMYDTAGRMTKTYIIEKNSIGQYIERTIQIQKHKLFNNVTSN